MAFARSCIDRLPRRSAELDPGRHYGHTKNYKQRLGAPACARPPALKVLRGNEIGMVDKPMESRGSARPSVIQSLGRITEQGQSGALRVGNPRGWRVRLVHDAAWADGRRGRFSRAHYV